jgi:hypothetical protein
MVTLKLTKEQFDTLVLLSRAPSFRGPADCNAYAIPRERMEVLRKVLKKKPQGEVKYRCGECLNEFYIPKNCPECGSAAYSV